MTTLTSSQPNSPYRTVVHDTSRAPSVSRAPVVPLLAAALVAVALVPLGPSETSRYDAVPVGGTNLTTAAPGVDDAWLDAPHGVAAGASAPLRLTLVNTRHQAGLALTGVTSPAISRSVLRQDGRVVRDIRLPADGNPVDLEWGGASGIVLVGLRHSLTAGAYLPITLHYSDGSSEPLHVDAGPLGGISTQRQT